MKNRARHCAALGRAKNSSHIPVWGESLPDSPLWEAYLRAARGDGQADSHGVSRGRRGRRAGEIKAPGGGPGDGAEGRRKVRPPGPEIQGAGRLFHAKGPPLGGPFQRNLGVVLLSHTKVCSIMGDEELDCRVRNGVGYTLFSMDAKEIP